LDWARAGRLTLRNTSLAVAWRAWTLSFRDRDSI
jgi:hypothetical protein